MQTLKETESRMVENINKIFGKAGYADGHLHRFWKQCNDDNMLEQFYIDDRHTPFRGKSSLMEITRQLQTLRMVMADGIWAKVSVRNVTDNVASDDMDWYKTQFDTIGDLYRYFNSHYGRAGLILIDGKKAGWYFTRTIHEDDGSSWVRECWAWVGLKDKAGKIIRYPFK